MYSDEESNHEVFGQVEAMLGKTFQEFTVSEFTALLKEIEQFDVKISVRNGQYILGGRWAAMQEIYQFLSQKCSGNQSSKKSANRREVRNSYEEPLKYKAHSAYENSQTREVTAKQYEQPAGYEENPRDQNLLGAAGTTKKCDRDFTDYGGGDYDDRCKENKRGTHSGNVNRINPQKRVDFRDFKGSEDRIPSAAARKSNDKGRHHVSETDRENSAEPKKGAAAVEGADPDESELLNAKDLILDRDIWLYICGKLKSQLSEVQSFGAKITVKNSDAGTVRVIVSSPTEVDDCDVVSLVHDSLVQLSADVISNIVVEAVNYSIDTTDVTQIMYNYVEENFPKVLLKWAQNRRQNWYSFIGPSTDVAYALAEFRRGVMTGLRTKSQRKIRAEGLEDPGDRLETGDVRPRRVKPVRKESAEELQQVERDDHVREDPQDFHSTGDIYDSSAPREQDYSSQRNEPHKTQEDYVRFGKGKHKNLKEKKIDLSAAEMESQDVLRAEEVYETGKALLEEVELDAVVKTKADAAEIQDSDVDLPEKQIVDVVINQRREEEICSAETNKGTQDEKNITVDVNVKSPLTKEDEEAESKDREHKNKRDEEYNDHTYNSDEDDEFSRSFSDSRIGESMNTKAETVKQLNVLKDDGEKRESYQATKKAVLEDSDESEDDFAASALKLVDQDSQKNLNCAVGKIRTVAVPVARAAVDSLSGLDDLPDLEAEQTRELRSDEESFDDVGEKDLMLNKGTSDVLVSGESADSMTREKAAKKDETLVEKLCSTIIIEGATYTFKAVEQADLHLAGYGDAGTIVVTVECSSEGVAPEEYCIYDDYDDEDEINELLFLAYIAATAEGRAVVKLMQQVFLQSKLLKPEKISGRTAYVARVELKSSLTGENGYPDDRYLNRLTDQLSILLNEG